MTRSIRKLQSEHGFTLIELLVVIAILGILAGVVVFATGGLGDRGQESACRMDERTIATAQEAHYAQNNRTYANNVGELVTKGLLNSSSSWHTTDNTGAVTPVAGGPCAD